MTYTGEVMNQFPEMQITRHWAYDPDVKVLVFTWVKILLRPAMFFTNEHVMAIAFPKRWSLGFFPLLISWSTQATLQWLLQTTEILHVPLKRPSGGAQAAKIESCPLPVLPGRVSRSQTTLMTFFMVEKLVTCSMNSFLFPTLPLFLSPPLLLNTPKPSVQMNCLSMSNSADQFCLLPNRSGADLPSIEICWSETLIWNNLPHSDQFSHPDTFSQREWINKNVPYADHPLLFTLLARFSGSLQDGRLVLAFSIRELTSALCVCSVLWIATNDLLLMSAYSELRNGKKKQEKEWKERKNKGEKEFLYIFCSAT